VIKVTKDGRTIRTGTDYTGFRRVVHRGQWGNCLNCGRNTSLTVAFESDFSFHLTHCGTRGLGGSLRDDVLGTKKGQVEGGKCGKCHRAEHATKDRAR
jgi:hypothetical protein